MEASITGMESQAAAGEPAFRRMVADGHSRRMRDDRAYLAANTSAWRPPSDSEPLTGAHRKRSGTANGTVGGTTGGTADGATPNSRRTR